MKKFALMVMMLSAVTGFGTVLQKDTMEIGLNGSLDFENLNGKVETDTKLSLGYFVLDDIQAGGLIEFGYNGEDYGYGFGPYGEVNFDLDTAVVPYLALRMTLNFGDYYLHDHLLLEGAGGLKFFLSESVAIAVEMYYDLANRDIFINNQKEENDDFGLHAGIRSYF